MNDISEEKAVARLAEILALERGVHLAVAKQIGAAAVFHDVGKFKVPEGILNKPGILDEREFEIMKTHTIIGAGMFKGISGTTAEIARIIAMYHHEKHDSSGYWGKYTDELPCYVAITGIADVYVALLSKRPYKDAWQKEDALEYIASQAGTQFSPALVKVFLPLARYDKRVSAVLEGGGVIARGT